MTRRVRVMLALACLLLAVDTLAWLVAQHVLDRHLARLEATAGRAGWQFTGSSRTHGGWPLAATQSIVVPALHPVGVSKGVGWTGARLTATLSLLHPGEMTIRLGGAQAISTNRAVPTDDLRGALRFIGDDLVLAIPSGRHAGQLRFGATRLRVVLPAGTGLAALRVRHLDGRLRWSKAATAVEVAAHDLELDGSPTGPGLDAGAGLLEASLVGPFGPQVPDWTERLRAWRDGGGRLIVAHAVLQWPDARLEAAGNAALDGNLRPDGAFSLHMLGPDALLDRSTHARLVSPAQAVSIRAVLGLIAAAADAPGRGQSLTLPLDLHGGTLSLGRIPLLQFPPGSPASDATTTAGPLPTP